MSMRYKGSRLSATANTPTSLTASGAWTLQQQMQANGTSTWPFVRDPQFNYVTMLLHGDGSAGANNGSGGGATPTVTAFNTDASTNNFNVTINGDARSNNFNPYQSGYYSNYFDGSGDYLLFADNAGLEIGTNSFTFEAWIYLTAYSPAYGGSQYVSTVGAKEGTNGSVSYRLVIVGTASSYTALHWQTYSNDSTAVTTSASYAFALNTWYHVAAVRNGTTVTLYVNGTSIGSGTDATNSQNTSAPFRVGSIGYTNYEYYFPGYISNLRLVNGTAVYTSNFTPSTTPLTAITNTAILTCQSNRFVDNSTNNAAVTVYGNTAVAPAQPFTLPSSVATYGSGYFDGTGDTLTTSTSQIIPTGSFTVECWAYVTGTGSNQKFVAQGSSGAAGRFSLGIEGGNWWVQLGGDAIQTGTPVKNQWNYVAVTYNGSTITLYVNGTSIGTVSSTANAQNTTLTIGQDWNSYIVTGYVADVRISNTVRTITTPTAPYSSDANTRLLTTQYNGGGNNSGFKDSSLNNFAITRNGNTTQGTFAPYGSNWANYFDGTGDYLTAANNTALDVGTGAFTIEGWIYRDGTGDADWRIIAGNTSSAGFFGGRGTLSLGFGRSGVAWDLESSSNVYSLNTWTHVVYVRNGSGNLAIFANGTRVATTTNSNNYGLNGGLIEVGAEGANQYFGGYISNVRVVKGSAVYDPTVSTLTVPTTPLTAVSGTGLLTCQSNRFIDNSTNNFTLTVNGNTSVQRFSPFANATAYNPATLGGSAYFDGSGDYLVTSGTGGFNPRSTFTIDFWTYPISNNTITWINSNTNNSFYFETAGTTLYVGDGLNNTIGTSAPTVNQWTHLLLSFDGTTYRLFYNGVLQASSTTLLQSAVITAFRIGQKQDGTRPFYGYITDMRVFVGTALYTAAFTPPTAPLTPTANTSLLLSTTNSAILDQAMMNDLETVGNAQISTSVVKYGTASMYFDGSGDWLTVPYRPTQNFGTGAFTIEMWAYLNSLSASYYVPAGTWGSGTSDEWLIQIQNNGSIRFLTTSGSTFYSASITTATWYHIAVVRSGSTVTIYVNGTSVGSYTCTNSLGSTAKTLYIGTQAGTWDWNGYIDDFRITNGVARYTTTFTPPTQALPNG